MEMKQVGPLKIIQSAIKRISLFLGFLIALTPIVSAAGGDDAFDRPSIHQLQLMQHRDTPIEPQTAVARPKRTRSLTHTVYGWYPYWMGSAYLNLEWDLISHLSFFSLEADSTGAITSYNGWPGSWSGLITTAQNAGVPITLTCTLFNSTAINTLIGNATYRSNLITNLVNACLAGGAQGVNIDFEGSSLHSGNLVLFMTQLRTALNAAIPGAHLSMATPAVDWSGCFDYDALAAQCDTLIAMCYDYHWKGGGPGPVSPLTAGSVWSQWCVTWTVNDYITYLTPRDKLSVGVPYYGYDWVVNGDPSTYPAADGPGDASARLYGYIQSSHGGYTKYWDTHSQTPWYYYYSGSDPRQVWYDDAGSLSLKYDFVRDEELAGIGIWALGYDDGYTELWDAIAAYFTSPFTPTPVPTVTPVPTATPVPTQPPTATPEPTPWTLIVDNHEPACTVTGTHWIVGTYGDIYGPDKLYSSAGTGQGAAAYAATLPAGTYSVSAWVNHAGYATAAEYTIHHAGGTDTVFRSQYNAGGQWCIDLGDYAFDGPGIVSVSDNAASGIVIADAIRWVMTGPAPATPTPTATASPAPSPTSTPTATHTATPTATPTATHTATPTATMTATPECLHHGDVNGDGSISAGDAQMAFFIVLGTISPSPEEACAADCSGDGSITAADAQMIFLTALGSANCADPL